MPISHNRHPNAFPKALHFQNNIRNNDLPVEINNFPDNLSPQLATKRPIQRRTFSRSDELDRQPTKSRNY